MKKVFLIFVSVIVLIFILAILGSRDDTPNNSSSRSTTSRLNDPNLFYSSRRWAGLCGNEKGERGGCGSELYLYNSGTTTSVSIFYPYSSGAQKNSVAEAKLTDAESGKVRKILIDADLSFKKCPPLRIMDAGWNYSVNFGEKMIEFRNPPPECRAVFDNVDQILDTLFKTKK